MVYVNREFNQYRLTYYNFLEATADGRGDYETTGDIELIFDNETVAYVDFYDEIPIRRNSYTGGFFPVIYINFHLSRFNEIFNILRNVRPLFVWLDTNGWRGGIYSNAVSIG